MGTSFKAKLAQFLPERQARIKSDADRLEAEYSIDVNDEMLDAEMERLGLRVRSMSSFRCNSLGFLFGE